MNKICLYNGTVLTGAAVMEDCSVLIEDKSIKDVFSNQRFREKRFGPDVQIIDAGGAYITPGFIDTHIHGFGGVGVDDAVYPQVKTEDEVIDIMKELSMLLVRQGVTAFNPTVYPAQKEIFPDVVSKIAAAAGREEGAQIMWLHLEGPFLSRPKAGVQRLETLSPVDLDYMEKIWKASGGRIVNMTVAPEIKNMRELAIYCAEKGIILQAGHTDAGFEQMMEGIQAGILHATHMFNAMSKLDQRNPNAVGAILTHAEFSCEIIADGIHVHPNLFKLLAQNKPMNKIVMVTDSLKCTMQQHLCTMQKSAPLFANGQEMELSGGLYKRKADGVIAGSNITMIQGVKNMASFGYTLEDAVRTASSNPASVMRYTKKGFLKPGMDADIAVFDKDFKVLAAIAGGQIKFNNF